MDYNKQNQNEYGMIFAIGSLDDYLKKVEDTRKVKRHKLIDMLVLMLLVKLSGEDKPTWIAEWVAHRKGILEGYDLCQAGRVASHMMTYPRIMAETISIEEFEGIVQAYHKEKG